MSTTDVRVLVVISEHPGGLSEERLGDYEDVRRRIASLTPAAVVAAQYATLDEIDADAVVLSGSQEPWATHDDSELERFLAMLRAYRGPALGICAGMQLQVRAAGGTIGPASRPSRGFGSVDVRDESDLFAGLGPRFEALAHHDDEVKELPAGLRVTASSASCAVEAIAADDRPWWGTQFHPERWDDDHPAGRAILQHYLTLAGVGAPTPAGPG